MNVAAMSATLSRAVHGGSFETSPKRQKGEVSKAPLKPQTTANLPIPETGTAVAINYLTVGVAAHLPCSTGRGGARNRADRESHALTVAQIGNLEAAERHARAIGLPFTRMITIHWQAAGVALADIVKATGRFIDLLTKTLARHGSKTAWLWILENGDWKGGHCHLLIHVPATLGDYADHIHFVTGKAAEGDLEMVSKILAAQAITLDGMFAELARRAALNMGEYISAAERYGRLALKAQSNCRATLDTLAKLHQPREQTVRHVHVNEGGQAIVANQFHNHSGGQSAISGNEMQMPELRTFSETEPVENPQ